ncbi:hypothetical protein BDV96DRAFT_646437 [Lophiotrema nucula]|uniref:Heterokaryon incompatibility domain-containing protein n=1 Tax=Lophiotrema nucula TaxID=690887 RepID=A0A6A5Z7Q4_9PLEO|nr:hypothetical protein BDV96DRAFT_646437 [Lophiotrema nucula]
MAALRLVGQRYLWVDRFYIVQNDPVHMYSQLHGMAAIYSNASFTLVAEDGVDDSHGLPGVPAERFRDRKLPWRRLRPSPELQLVSSHEFFPRQTLRYHQRAWTFPEFELSNRKVIFSGNTVTWECRLHSCKENETLPRPHQNSFGYSRSSQDSLTWYAKKVEEYNHRLLTYPDDALQAFSATLSAASRSIPDGVFLGVPEALLNVCLLWEPNSRPSSSLTRRRDGNMKLLHQFPSWSWIGWIGKVRLKSWNWETFCKTTPLVAWHRRKNQVPSTLVEDAGNEGWEAIPCRTSLELPDTVLETKDDKEMYLERRCELICPSKGFVDFLSEDDPFEHFPEFYLLHTGCEPQCNQDGCIAERSATFYKFYNPLMIEWREGVAYRVTCGRIFEEAWDMAEKGEIDVLLG